MLSLYPSPSLSLSAGNIWIIITIICWIAKYQTVHHHLHIRFKCEEIAFNLKESRWCLKNCDFVVWNFSIRSIHGSVTNKIVSSTFLGWRSCKENKFKLGEKRMTSSSKKNCSRTPSVFLSFIQSIGFYFALQKYNYSFQDILERT